VILLDTNICIHIINASPAAVLERFRQYRMGQIGVSSVVAASCAPNSNGAAHRSVRWTR
jgi:tRNA(fMet)-specific endonuclease VapC